VVELVAEVEEGYCFVDWTDDSSTIANANTAITVQGNYRITAGIEERNGCFITTATYGTSMAEEMQPCVTSEMNTCSPQPGRTSPGRPLLQGQSANS